MKLIGDHLASILWRDLNTIMDFTILADESIGSNHRSIIGSNHRSIIGSNHRPIEHFLGITYIAISKTAAAIMDITNNFLILKEIQPF